MGLGMKGRNPTPPPFFFICYYWSGGEFILSFRKSDGERCFCGGMEDENLDQWGRVPNYQGSSTSHPESRWDK